MLPNESLLQVLHFVDYGTLVLVKLAGKRFLRLAEKFAEELARHRRFHVAFYTGCVIFSDGPPTGERFQSIGYERGNQASLEVVCQKIVGMIGPHAVAELMFWGSTWNTPGVDVVFKAAPPLKYAEEVVLYSYSRDGPISEGNCESFLSNFVEMKSLRLYLDNHTFSQFFWTFLEREYARGLRRVAVRVPRLSPHFPTEDVSQPLEELVRYFVKLPRKTCTAALEMDFPEMYFSLPLVLRITELLNGCGRDTTFRLRTLRDDGELTLNGSDYTADVEGITTRYTSEKSGFAVEVKGDSITIRSTARRGRNQEVLPVMLSA